jgi:hypothetical protein
VKVIVTAYLGVQTFTWCWSSGEVIEELPSAQWCSSQYKTQALAIGYWSCFLFVVLFCLFKIRILDPLQGACSRE